MNANINELIKQSTEDILGVPVLNPQTLSLLVIQECLKQCEQHFAGAVGTYAGAHNVAVKKCRDSIKAYFEIE